MKFSDALSAIQNVNESFKHKYMLSECPVQMHGYYTPPWYNKMQNFSEQMKNNIAFSYIIIHYLVSHI